MGLLNSNSLNDYLTKTIPQNARNIWEAVKRAPSDLQALGSPQMNTQVRQAMNKPATLDRNAAMGMAMDYLQTTNPMGGLLAHTVYHGSPHKFNKFDMSKIGTGEGAQAYGHGLYMAESPEVAKSYSLLGHMQGNTGKIGGKEITDYYSAIENKANRLPHPAAQEYYDRMALVESLMNNEQASDVLKYATDNNYPASVIEWFKKEVAPTYEPAGNLYKVDIPDESIPRMLDWDKPLSQQAPEVQSAMKSRGISLDDKYWHNNLMNSFMSTPEGKSGSFNDLNAAATDYLKAQGIPGIRYLDAMSRDKGGTSNFVLFDDQLPRILEVNGQPTGLLSYADEAKKVKKK